ncbi:MAG: glutaminase domain-containing protein, partial [Spirochaetia bacterium]
NEQKRLVVFGYDDVHSIEYFGERLSAYCFRNGEHFEALFARAVEEYEELSERCDEFDRTLRETALEAGGRRYADICALAYRQAIAAHKLVADVDGAPLFFSKECFSNGSIATVDVTYPSTPLFFLYKPELVEAMLKPIFRFASSPEWPKQYAPHDAGTYPRANGQTYGVHIRAIDETRQMPVEECGNMLILTAALSRATGDTRVAEAHHALLRQWADYLLTHGYDPDHQLCTDDFAGHLAHNANLSVKAIVALAAFADLCDMLGRPEEGAKHREAAEDYAKRWEQDAHEEDHYKLTLVDSGTWSLKYNLVWDRLLGYSLFAPEIFEREVSWYRRCCNRYGTPLDNRSMFTKADWIVWAACLTDDEEAFRDLVEPIWDFLNETPSRTPFSDWYGTTDAAEHSFHHRSVVGGVFMKLATAAFRPKS